MTNRKCQKWDFAKVGIAITQTTTGDRLIDPLFYNDTLTGIREKLIEL